MLELAKRIFQQPARAVQSLKDLPGCFSRPEWWMVTTAARSGGRARKPAGKPKPERANKKAGVWEISFFLATPRTERRGVWTPNGLQEGALAELARTGKYAQLYETG